MVHDWMCVYHNSVGYDRNFSSRVFRALLLSAGVGKVKAQVMYLAVDNFQRFCGWRAERICGRANGVSPDSEQIEPACAKHKRRNSVSVEQIQDRVKAAAIPV